LYFVGFRKLHTVLTKNMVYSGEVVEPEGKEYFPPDFKPKVLLVVSGKRKCGKDYFTDLLLKRYK
jgi:hypothetical protein